MWVLDSLLDPLPYRWAEYEANGPRDRKRRRTTDFVEMNDAVYKYCLAKQTNMPGTTSTSDADTKFKASNGWLDSLILSK